jgi:hypothetical protein
MCVLCENVINMDTASCVTFGDKNINQYEVRASVPSREFTQF